MAILKHTMNRRVRAALVVGCLLVVGCIADRPRLPAAEELAAETGADAETLRAGRTTYLQNCTECHRLYWPGEYPAAAWRRILPDMGDRSGLSRAEIRDLTAFLVAASRQR